MPTVTIDIKELPARFGEMVALAARGTDILVLEGGTPRARLAPLPPAEGRVAGLHAGALQTTDDFDAPLPEEFWTGMP